MLSPTEPIDRPLSIDELANLPPDERTKSKIKATAHHLDLSVTDVRKAIQTRSRPDLESSRGRPVELEEPDPWHEPVSGQILLGEISDEISSRIALEKTQADAIALWVAHAFCFDVFLHTPRLLITAPEQACGKTALMSHVVGQLVPRAIPVEMMRPAPFFRLAEEHKPVFLIDEVDAFLKQDSELVSALNAGFEAHGSVPRCIGEDNEVRLFRPHCPVAMAGIDLLNKLPVATLSRCIVIRMDRATAEQLRGLAKLRRGDHVLLTLARKIARWVQDNSSLLLSGYDGEEVGREANKWHPLFCIANCAGDEWPQRCKEAFQVLQADEDTQESKGHELLVDVRAAFGHGEKLFTTDLIERICLDEDGPWYTYNFRQREDKRITPRQFANLLRPYGIRPKQIRIGNSTGKGYERRDFQVAFARYLPLNNELTKQVNKISDLSNLTTETSLPTVSDEECVKSLKSNNCFGVSSSAVQQESIEDYQSGERIY